MKSKQIILLGSFLFLSGNAALVAQTGTWALTGNSVAPGQFLGSTNNQPVELWADGYRILRLEPDPGNAFGGNIVGGCISNRVDQPGSGGNVISGGGWYGGLNTVLTNTRGAFIGAGSENHIGPNLNDSVIGGGYGNIVGGYDSFIGAGYSNVIAGPGGYSFIGGGYYNVASNTAATISGGAGN